MTKINYKKFSRLVNNFKKFCIGVADKNHGYFKRTEYMLDNRVNNYINFLNFQGISNFFSKKKELRILDLGCGVGDKSFLLKKLFSKSHIIGLETTNHDDIDHVKNKPHEFYENIYKKINKKFGLELNMYDGKNIPSKFGNFDVIILYAVIEHITPGKRTDFIHSVEKRLKNNGYFVITRCPRRLGLIEFVSRTFKLGAHEWVLSKKDLLNLFPQNYYQIKVFKNMNNIPNNYFFSKYFYYPLMLTDKILSLFRWPFSTDYFLIVKKK